MTEIVNQEVALVEKAEWKERYMRTASQGKARRLFAFPEHYVVVDIETTGLNPGAAQIIEISALKVESHQVVDTFTALVRPSRPVSAFITNLTGITNAMVAKAPPVEAVLPDFLEFLGDAIILGQNIRFDIRFLDYDLQRHFGITLMNDHMDLLRITRRLLPDLPNRRLQTVAKRYGISTEGAHRGLRDCEMTLECYHRCTAEVLERYGSLEAFLK